MPLRLLIAAIIIFLAIALIKRLRRSKHDKHQKLDKAFTETVSCKNCGLRLPKSEAIENNGDYFCCQAHLDD